MPLIDEIQDISYYEATQLKKNLVIFMWIGQVKIQKKKLNIVKK